jgi:hypothetical protein
MPRPRTVLPLFVGLLAAAVIGFVIGRGTNPRSAGPSTPPAAPAPTTTTFPGQFSEGDFVGDWYHHDLGMTISADGWGMFEWPTGKDCSSSQAPCDYLYQNGHLVYGGYAIFGLSKPTGESMQGHVFETNDAREIPTGSLMIKLDAGNEMGLVVLADGQQVPVCGPDAKEPAAAAC